MRIDSHVHITETGKWFNTNSNSSLGALLREMDKSKIDKSVVLPISGIIKNAFVAKVIKDNPDRIIGFGGVSAKTWRLELSEIEEMNLKGVKFHPRIQNESIEEWDRLGILEELDRRSLPLLICGWQQTSASKADMISIQPLIIDRVAKKYPSLKIIIAHMGGHKFYDAFFCARGNPNVFLDCSYFFQFFKGTSLEIDALTLLSKIDEKVLFGSDFPEVNISENLKYFESKSENYQFDFSKLLCTNIGKLIKI
jgi:predicted TIM-barrel fold metal-dependent hydrolase